MAAGMIEHVFDSIGLEGLAGAGDAVVVDAVSGWARDEAGSAARRLAAIAEVVVRRCGPDEDDDERGLWSCDRWDATAAEIGAALGVTARRASSQMYLARSLRERLPKVNAVFLAGRVAARIVATISWRTHLVIDEAAMAAIDADLAAVITGWGTLSQARVDTAVDEAVAVHDPDARRWFEAAEQGMDIQFGKPDDETGTCSVWGRMYLTHAELIQRRLTAMARAVCAADPRTVGQRRAEAMAAVFTGADRIACLCGAGDCPQPTTDALAGSVVIHLLAEQAAVATAQRSLTANRNTAGRPAAQQDTDESAAEDVAAEDAAAEDAAAPGVVTDDTETAETAESVEGCEGLGSAAAPVVRAPVAVMTVGGVVPTGLLEQLLRNGATLAPLRAPGADPEPGYRPSAALQRFVRCRDMTCRFPGCDAPAEHCDIDHAVAYPLGATHASNLRCVCRKHHLLKTFWVGDDGWSDQQFPDGRIVWTSPTGRRYTTYPGSRVHFPHWDTRTAELPPPPADAPTPANRALRMPLRRRTRTKDLTARIKNRRTHQDTS